MQKAKVKIKLPGAASLFGSFPRAPAAQALREVAVNPPEQDRKYSTYHDKSCKHSMLDAPGAWSPARSEKGAWLQLDLGAEKKVTGTVVQGCPDKDLRVTQYKVQHSKDGKKWNELAPMFQVPTNITSRNQRVEGKFPHAVEARYLKLLAQSWKGRTIALRAGVLVLQDEEEEEEDEAKQVVAEPPPQLPMDSEEQEHQAEVEMTACGRGAELLQAAQLGDVYAVDHLLDHGADVNHSEDGMTALRIALTLRHAQVVRRLQRHLGLVVTGEEEELMTKLLLGHEVTMSQPLGAQQLPGCRGCAEDDGGPQAGGDTGAPRQPLVPAPPKRPPPPELLSALKRLPPPEGRVVPTPARKLQRVGSGPGEEPEEPFGDSPEAAAQAPGEAKSVWEVCEAEGGAVQGGVEVQAQQEPPAFFAGGVLPWWLFLVGTTWEDTKPAPRRKEYLLFQDRGCLVALIAGATVHHGGGRVLLQPVEGGLQWGGNRRAVQAPGTRPPAMFMLRPADAQLDQLRWRYPDGTVAYVWRPKCGGAGQLPPPQPTAPPPQAALTLLPEPRPEPEPQILSDDIWQGVKLDVVTYGLRYQALVPEDTDLQFDMRLFRDPAAGPLRTHDGHNPEIISRLVGHEEFPGWIAEFRREVEAALVARRAPSAGGAAAEAPGSEAPEGAAAEAAEAAEEAAAQREPLRIGLCCNAGRHRSVAGGVLVQRIGEFAGFDVSLRHLTLHRCGCEGCGWDAASMPKVERAVSFAWELWRRAA